MSRSILVFCLLAAIAVAFADEPERVVGGSTAAPGEFPYVISIQLNGNHFCGGAILDSVHILTAAHCVMPLISRIPNVLIAAGTNNVYSGGSRHRVASMVYHPQYSPKTHGVNWYYDVGVITLADPIQFDHLRQKIDLPTSPPPVNVNAVIAGWGKTDGSPQTPGATVLQKIFLPIIPQHICQQHHPVPITDVMICTYRQVNMGTCNGDSGGPLAYNGKVIGIVSGGVPCAVGAADIFTNVYTVLSFIYDALRM